MKNNFTMAKAINGTSHKREQLAKIILAVVPVFYFLITI